MTPEQQQELFNYFMQAYGIALLQSEMNDISYIVLGREEYLKRANHLDL